MKNQKIFALIFKSLLFANISYSQMDSLTADSIVRSILYDYDSAGYYYVNPNTIQAGELFTLYKSYWASDSFNDLRFESSVPDKSVGTIHNTYKQFFMNIPVEGAFLKEHIDEHGFVKWVNGRVVYDLDVINSGVHEEQAILTVLDALPNHEFYWDNYDLEQDIKIELNNTDATYYPQPELWWTRLPNLENARLFNKTQYRLCWKFRIKSLAPYVDRYYWVDAENLSIIKTQEAHESDGPADTFYYGQRTVDSRWAGSWLKHILDSDGQNRNIHTKKNNYTLWGTRPNYKDDNDIWNADNIAGTSAHWVVQSAWDMFANTSYMAINGTNDDGAEIRVVANFYSAYSSAWWIHENKDIQVITFDVLTDDEGEVVTYATLDRAGHEFGHGVNHYLGDLDSDGEAHELQEGLCDIYGFLVERFTLDPNATCTLSTDECDWLMGEDQGLARNIENPADTDNPHTYEGAFYDSDDNDHHHLNSTVLSHWFYLLSLGGSGINDNEYTYTLSGIGIDKAAEIAYQTHIHNVAGADGFDQMRAGSIAQAIDIHGANSNEHIQTVCAWAAVGVGGVGDCSLLSSQSISSNQGLGNLMLYPNPAGRNLNIVFPNRSNWNIVVFCTDGTKLLEITAPLSEKFNLEIHDLPSGVYFVKAFNEYGTISSRFVKVSE